MKWLAWLLIMVFAALGLHNPAHAAIAGLINGTTADSTGTYLVGWACEVGVARSVQVKFWLGRPHPRGTLFITDDADLPNTTGEAGIEAACGTNNVNHRFKILVSPTARTTHYGKPIFATVTVGADNLPLTGIGRVHAPYIFSVDTYGGDPTGTLDSMTAFLAAKNAALNFPHRPVEVHFSKGFYRFNCTDVGDTACIELTAPTGQPPGPQQGPLLITGYEGGTEIRLYNIRAGFLKVNNFIGFAITDLAFDYPEEAPFFHGKITAITDSYMDFQKDASSAALTQAMCDTIATTPQSWGAVMNPITKGIKAVQGYAQPIFHTSCTKNPTTSGKWRFGLNSALDLSGYISVNDPYVLLYSRNANRSLIWINQSQNVRADNLTTYSGGSVNLMLTRNSGFLDVRGVDIRFKPGSTRLVTTAADGVHLQGNRAKPVIEECYMEGMLDDGINNHVTPAIVTQVISPTSFKLFHGNVEFIEGDDIQFYNQTTGLLRREVEISSVTALGGGVYTVNTATAVTGVLVNEWVFNTAAAGPESSIRINIFGKHGGRSVITRSKNSLVEWNTFNAITVHAILFDTNARTTGPIQFTAGPVAHDFIIRNDVFWGGDFTTGHQIVGRNDTLSGAPAVDGPYNITIQDNKFRNPRGYAISLEQSKGFTISGVKLYSSTDIRGIRLISPNGPNTVSGITYQDNPVGLVPPYYVVQP